MPTHFRFLVINSRYITFSSLAHSPILHKQNFLVSTYCTNQSLKKLKLMRLKTGFESVFNQFQTGC